MEIFKLFGSILVDSGEAEKSIQKTESKAGKLVSTLGSGIKTAAKWGAGLVAGAATAASAAVAALNKVDEETREYRENQAKLQSAYEASGSSSSVAAEAYRRLYKILGDDGEATEATQLLAKLANNTESVGLWADIAAGVMGTFGDALPITSLIEASNETAKVGTVTGALADALNWAGISEDAFNEKLAACSDEQERNRLITYTLSRTYDAASEAYKTNSEEAIKNREAQLQSTETMAKLGTVVASVKTRLSEEFSPSLNQAANAFINLITGAEGADKALQESVENMVQTAVDKLPEFLAFGVDVIGSIATGIVKSIPSLVKAVPEIGKALVDALLDLGGELFSAGKELLGYLWSGFSSAATKYIGDRSTALAQSGFSHASGLAYVPYDNYPINAHRGEVLLNANDAGNLLDGMRSIMSASVNAMGALGNGVVRVEIPISINGREFYRASIDDLRAVMRSDPEVA